MLWKKPHKSGVHLWRLFWWTKGLNIVSMCFLQLLFFDDNPNSNQKLPLGFVKNQGNAKFWGWPTKNCHYSFSTATKHQRISQKSAMLTHGPITVVHMGYNICEPLASGACCHSTPLLFLSFSVVVADSTPIFKWHSATYCIRYNFNIGMINNN